MFAEWLVLGALLLIAIGMAVAVPKPLNALGIMATIAIVIVGAMAYFEIDVTYFFYGMVALVIAVVFWILYPKIKKMVIEVFKYLTKR